EHCNGRGLIVSTELTELPPAPGRNGQQTGPPKPGSTRSRSARSKAIAQVAAKTIESEAARPDGGAMADDQTVEPAAARAAAAATAEPPASPETGPVGAVTAGSSGAGRSGAGRSGAGAAGAGAAGAGAAVSDSGAGAGESGGAASAVQPAAAESEPAPRRRPRRSAHREAGPPDSALTVVAAPVAEAGGPEAASPAGGGEAASPADQPDGAGPEAASDD
ncbi:MAG TPA: hypothetical protein VEM58_03880, partial [Streptosporangiaceae bacterium]|nr:hypothetical protein [Streptosporangiaceae bacterium]